MFRYLSNSASLSELQTSDTEDITTGLSRLSVHLTNPGHSSRQTTRAHFSGCNSILQDRGAFLFIYSLLMSANIISNFFQYTAVVRNDFLWSSSFNPRINCGSSSATLSPQDARQTKDSSILKYIIFFFPREVEDWALDNLESPGHWGPKVSAETLPGSGSGSLAVRKLRTGRSSERRSGGVGPSCARPSARSGSPARATALVTTAAGSKTPKRLAERGGVGGEGGECRAP